MKALKPILILCVATLFATACKKDVDMTLVQKTLFENADIRHIEVDDAWQVTIIADSNSFVELEYSAYLEPYLKAKMDGSKLEIGFNGNVYPAINSNFRATVHTPLIEKLEASEAAKVHCNGSFQGHSIEVSLSDASQCTSLVFSGETCEIKMEDASLLTGFQFVGNTCKAHLEDASQFNGQIHSSDLLEIALESASRFVNKGGETATANVKLQESSILNMAETLVETLHIELRSASEATVHASGLIEGSLTEASTLYYKGLPQLQVDCDESSSVVPL